MVRFLRCRLGDHEYVQRSENDRLYLECIHCGKTTEGWDLGKEAIPGSQAFYDAAYAELQSMELELHGGG